MGWSGRSPWSTDVNGRLFGRRLLHNVCRHFWLFLLPVLLLGGLGVVQVVRAPTWYESVAVVNVAPNPLISSLDDRVGSGTGDETLAEATSNSINERLETKQFLRSVLEWAGLLEAYEAGFVPPLTVRTNVQAEADGNTILRVTARWTDPTTSTNLANGVVLETRRAIESALSTNSREAEAFYRERLAEAEAVAAGYEAAYGDFLAGLPDIAPGERRPLADEVELERLDAELTTALEQVAAAEDLVDDAELAGRQARSQANSILRVVDPPEVPREPTTDWLDDALSIATSVLLGVVTAAAAALITTALDRSFSIPAQSTALSGVDVVLTVPPLKKSARRLRRADRPPDRAPPRVRNRSDDTSHDRPVEVGA